MIYYDYDAKISKIVGVRVIESTRCYLVFFCYNNVQKFDKLIIGNYT